jgi:protocatechuate 4,5-dioxygenase alpha chain
MINTMKHQAIFGTTLFDGEQAQKGYALNNMCFSFNASTNRQDFKSNEGQYMDRYELTPAQRQAVTNRDVLDLIHQGGNIYYLAKFAGILGLDVQDLGAQQTGMTREAFCNKLLASARA